MIRPPKLQPGDTVLLVSPAGPSPAARIQCAQDRCRAFGLEPRLAPSATERYGYLAGRDEARAADFQRGIDDPDIAVIWAIRGGYGGMRLLRRLRFDRLRERPRAFIGFSDNTVLHLALLQTGVVSFHGPHAGGDPMPPETEVCFRRVLFEAEPAGVLPLPATDRPKTLVGGVAEGELVGGNLALLAAAAGTPIAVRGAGRILFIEDVGEATYRIDRMLLQLELSGALEGVAGIAFGQFTEVPENENDLPLEEVLGEWTARLGVPAAVGFPFGHGAQNWTLPLGVRARLDASAGTLELLEPAVR